MAHVDKTESFLLRLRSQDMPQYEMDNGPLTAEQSAAVHAHSTASSTPDERFSEGLFD